jgi:hypothetical protein
MLHVPAGLLMSFLSLKNPFSPQVAPQLFFTFQYGTPSCKDQGHIVTYHISTFNRLIRFCHASLSCSKYEMKLIECPDMKMTGGLGSESHVGGLGSESHVGGLGSESHVGGLGSESHVGGLGSQSQGFLSLGLR